MAPSRGDPEHGMRSPFQELGRGAGVAQGGDGIRGLLGVDRPQELQPATPSVVVRPVGRHGLDAAKQRGGEGDSPGVQQGGDQKIHFFRIFFEVGPNRRHGRSDAASDRRTHLDPSAQVREYERSRSVTGLRSARIVGGRADLSVALVRCCGAVAGRSEGGNLGLHRDGGSAVVTALRRQSFYSTHLDLHIDRQCPRCAFRRHHQWFRQNTYMARSSLAFVTVRRPAVPVVTLQRVISAGSDPVLFQALGPDRQAGGGGRGHTAKRSSRAEAPSGGAPRDRCPVGGPPGPIPGPHRGALFGYDDIEAFESIAAAGARLRSIRYLM